LCKKLGELRPGDEGRIVRISSSPSTDELVARLMEMGLLEGSDFTLVHEAPFGGDPIAVRVRGALIALRRSEANLIEVELKGGEARS